MSVESSISLRIVESASRAIVSPIKILKTLEVCNWNLVNQHGYVSYLPLGDDEMFDWTYDKIDVRSLMKILEEKELRDECIGVGVTWQDSDIGGTILLYSNKERAEKRIHSSMSFCLDGNRKILLDDGHSKITDVNWYLTKILPIFNQNDTIVEYYTYKEHI